MEDMSKYYFDKSQIKEQVALLDKYEQNSEEYKNQGMKIIASYCKPLILTNKGITYGLELMKKWESEVEMTRKELFDSYTIGVEAKLVTGGSGVYNQMSDIYKKMRERYNPDQTYLQSWIYDKLYPEGYLQENPNFTEVLHQSVKDYTENRPGLRAIFFTIDIDIMRDKP